MECTGHCVCVCVCVAHCWMPFTRRVHKLNHCNVYRSVNPFNGCTLCASTGFNLWQSDIGKHSCWITDQPHVRFRLFVHNTKWCEPTKSIAHLLLNQLNRQSDVKTSRRPVRSNGLCLWAACARQAIHIVHRMCHFAEHALGLRGWNTCSLQREFARSRSWKLKQYICDLDEIIWRKFIYILSSVALDILT